MARGVARPSRYYTVHPPNKLLCWLAMTGWRQETVLAGWLADWSDSALAAGLLQAQDLHLLASRYIM